MKHKYIAKRYWKDQSTPMGQVDELARQYDNVIDLSLGDPDVTTHHDIIHFAFEQAKLGHTKYTDFRGDPELRTAIKNYYQEDFNVALNDSSIMVTASACLAMYLVLESLCDPGDEVIIHAPYFTPYYQQIELAKGKPVVLDTCEADDFEVDIDKLKALINERTKAIVINSPNNPTGTVFKRETLQAVVDLAHKHDLVIISDEIYGAYAFEKPFISLAQLNNAREHTVIINSFSKDFTMTGWRVGNIIAPDYIIKTCQAINENVVFTAPSISQRAAIYALKHRKRIQASFIDEYRQRVMYAAKRVSDIPWMHVRQPQGTFYLFINIQKSGLLAARICQLLLEQARVLAIPGDAFGACGEGYIRIACTVEIDTIKQAFDQIAQLDLTK